MIIDVHTHIGKFGTIIASKTPEELLQSMDEAGIETSFLITNRLGHEVDGLATAKAVEIGEKYPRLKIIGNIEYATLAEDQVEELKGFLKAGRIIGVKLYTGYEEFLPFDPKLHDFYDFCSREGYPVIFHTGFLLQGSRGSLKSSHPLNIDELANAFPTLKIIMAHFGNPWIADCAAVVAKNENVYADLSGYFSEFMPISKNEVEMFKKEVGYMAWLLGGYKKLLFGTDWPIYSQKEYVRAVGSLHMSKEEKDLVFWKNARDIFRLG
ncbi:MAG: amidohydrolase family protein [bacterium]|nr:amidohydrolase family protein [bacterium]